VAPSVPEFSAEESLDELKTLATSAGAEIAGEFLQRRDRPDPATLIGKGKLEEIAGAAASVNADLILFDHDLTASQQRNIERAINRRVIDRTQLILDIFAKHARTREGQLQVELAQLEYMLPRLAGRGIEMSQLGGGIGTRGPGRNAARDGSSENLSANSSRQRATRRCAAHSFAAEAAAGIGARGYDCARRLHKRGKIDAFQFTDKSGRTGIGSHVCDG
jgi:50S ribosomal subunit-associated GTPase HflX